MNSFSEWLNAGVVKQSLKVGMSWVDGARDYMLSALNIYNFSETFYSVSHLKADVEQNIINNPKFIQHIQKYGDIQPRKNGVYGYASMCGKDSCAFFYTNKFVIKFLGGRKSHHEYKIAAAIKGKLKLVPIIDAFSLEMLKTEEVQYVVVMREIDTDVYHISSAIKEAANIVSGVMSNLQTLVENKPEIPIEYIRRRLSVAYMIRGSNVKDETKEAIRDLVRVIRLVYDKSGYLFGADFEQSRNIGINKKGKPTTFDFGRPDKHQAKYNDLLIKGELPKTDVDTDLSI
jgi:hypothetical protein